ncbi:MAG: N-acetylglucosamine-6-phosphate deacetylase [Acidobacteria bacterium]|nr:N-acetylglucosamine-6-phosphate deacetylase [Acidobacteriota bacterium]
MIVFTARRLYTPQESIDRPVVVVEGGRIVELYSQASRPIPAGLPVSDFGEGTLAPGYLDIHIHGNAGQDVMQAEAAGFSALEQSLARHGVTSYCPTTVTAPVDATLHALERLANEIEADGKPGGRARPLGIHLEGPFISHVRRGVHPPENILEPTPALFERFWQAARGHIRVMTIAPELPGAREVIALAAARGVCVSIGHSDADFATAQAAVAAGARHATHTFNAMRPLGHRDPGIIGEVLTDDRLSADLIADGIHLDPPIVELVLRAKGPERAVLITDAISATGMPEGKYRLGSFEVEVKDGKCLYEGKLAGSVLTMDRAVRNVMQFAHWDLARAVQAATLNPARALRLTDCGILKVGVPADFVVLASNGEIRKTIVRGAEF